MNDRWHISFFLGTLTTGVLLLIVASWEVKIAVALGMLVAVLAFAWDWYSERALRAREKELERLLLERIERENGP